MISDIEFQSNLLSLICIMNNNISAFTKKKKTDLNLLTPLMFVDLILDTSALHYKHCVHCVSYNILLQIACVTKCTIRLSVYVPFKEMHLKGENILQSDEVESICIIVL